MDEKLRKIIAILLLVTNFSQIAVAALPVANSAHGKYQQSQNAHTQQNAVDNTLQNVALSTRDLGITGPVQAGVNYSSLTGLFFNGQFLKLLTDRVGFNVLGEYGDNQTRINGTFGFMLGLQSFFKISAEQLGQRLPFYFSTGNVDQWVKQNAIGARFMQQMNASFLDNISAGAYLSKALDVRLAPISFLSNGSNCNGFGAGLRCMTERHIAGGKSSGADLGLGGYFSRSTYIEGRLYYDTLRYNTLFSKSRYDKSGYGGGVTAQHLLADNLKFSAGAEIRKIYNTYNLALSWMPPVSKIAGTELSLVAQRVVSQNQKNDDAIGLRVTLLADRANYQAPLYGLNGTPVVNSVASWVNLPAVKMNQVLVISEEITHLAATAINSITPNFGPLAGGNTVVISGDNFFSGAMVLIGGKIATITSSTLNTLTIIVPPGDAPGGVPVTVNTPDGKTTTIDNGYLYSNGIAPLITTTLSPAVGPTTGGTLVTVTGANFIATKTSVTINGTTIPASAVQVISPIELTFTTPPHPTPGTVLVTVTTPAGSGNSASGFTYEAVPTTTSLSPTAGPTAGGTVLTITGTGFAIGDTSVTIGGIVIPANAVTVNSSTSLTITTPAHAAGNVDVSVTTSGGTSNLVPGGFTYNNAAATVTSLSPTYGPTSGGTAVTIIGTNFNVGNTTVTIGGIVVPAGSVTVNSATSLTFNTPAHSAGNVDVLVTTPTGSSSTVPGGFNYEDIPLVTALSPSYGPIAGGTVVTINGSNFVSGNTTVTIGGTLIPAGSVLVNSASSLTFITPAHAAGTVAVTVTTPGGTSGAVPGGFTYEDVPTTTSLTPSFGPIAGGTLVTISGTNFVVGDTSVTIGGTMIPVGQVTVNSATSLTFTTPAHAAGNVAVTVTTSGGSSGAVPGGFTYEALPTTTALSPSFGPIAGGTIVSITGTNFVAGDTSVTIGGNVIPAGSVTVNSSTSLTFTTPAHAAGNVSVSVATSGGGTSNTVPGGFTYEALPSAVALTPGFGPIAGGTAVTITGTNFVAGNTAVTIGGTVVPAGMVTVNSATSLTFTTPAHAAGNVAVTVETPGGTSGAVPGGFTYEDVPTTTALAPGFGPIAGGTVVTISGTNFVTGDTSVTIGGILVPVGSVAVNSATSLTFTTPAHAAGNVSVSVSTSGGGTSNNVPGGFTYEALPTTTSLAPAFGPIAGGTLVTISGTNFVAGDTSVTIGGTVVPAGSVTVNSATSLTFTTPAHAAGNVSVTVATSGGGTSNNVPGGFTYEAQPTTVSLNPITGPTAGGTPVTITGTNFVAGDTSVTIGGNVVPAGSVTVNSSTSLTFNTPAHAAGNVSVSVTTSGGGTSNTVPGGFTYNDAAATVTSLTPAYGSVLGGTSVTIIGTNFVPGDTSVTIGGNVIPTGMVTVNSATSLTFSTPAHAAGNVSVSVATSVGSSGNVPGGFTYEDIPLTISLAPTSGPVAGGTSVTITGANFVAGDTSVTIGGNVVPAGSVTVNSSTSLTFSTPAHSAGNVAVTVATTGGGVSNAVPGGFNYTNAAATITGLSPNSGPISGGTSVTITGTNFVASNTSVTIGGNVVPAGSVTVNSSTSLTFTTPAHAAGNVAVTVTTPDGSSGAAPGGFTYEAIPSATSLAPAFGPIAGGTVVTISGTNFVAGDTSVTIGGISIPAGFVTVNSATSLTFITPAHVAGNVSVTVTTAGGTSGAVPGGFTYEALPLVVSLTPSFGPVAGGTSVTITGANFVVGDTSVTIGGILVPSGSVTVNSSTSLTFSTPAHAAGLVAVIVHTSGGTSGLVPGGFIYEEQPTVSALAPGFGPIAGGTVVTITGSNFVPGDTSVTIGGNVVPVGLVLVNSATSLTFATPAHAAGNVAVTVATSGGTSGAVPGGFTYEAQPTVSALTPSFGPIAGGTLVTITGANFVVGDTAVTIGGIVIPVGFVTVNSATSLTFTTPAHVAGNVSVNVMTSGGISGAVPGGFTYVAQPIVVSLTPGFGPIAGGTSVTITGVNFVAGDTSVTIGGNVVPVGSVTVNSSTSLTFNTPAHAAGNVTVSVTTSGGVSGVVPGGFTYVGLPVASSLTPTSGTTAGDTLVTITGANFVAGDTSVLIGGNVVAPAFVTVSSATSLNFRTPTHAAGNVAVSVKTSGGTSGAIPGGYTYLAPSLSSCSAPIPSLLGVQLLTCVGANLTLFDTTILKASGSAACSTFPAQQVTPTVNVLGLTLVLASDIPSILNLGLIGCNIQLCSNASCNVLGGAVGPVLVSLGL